MKYESLKLPDDPVRALAEVAGYIRTLRLGPDQRVSHGDDGREMGYWKTTEWWNGLATIGEECWRVAEAELGRCREAAKGRREMDAGELSGLLRVMAKAVAEGDSAEGRVEYASGRPGHYAAAVSLRIGSRDGQGGTMRVGC